jgi:hypothetical protein
VEVLDPAFHLRTNWTNTFITSGRTEYNSRRLTGLLRFYFSVFIRCRGNRCPAMDYSAAIRCSENMLNEPLLAMVIVRLVTETWVSELLASNGLFRISGIMSQYVSVSLTTLFSHGEWNTYCVHSDFAVRHKTLRFTTVSYYGKYGMHFRQNVLIQTSFVCCLRLPHREMLRSWCVPDAIPHTTHALLEMHLFQWIMNISQFCSPQDLKDQY